MQLNLKETINNVQKNLISKFKDSNNSIKLNHLKNSIKLKDTYTSQHTDRVSFLATKLAKHIGYSESELERIRLAATLHDLGKIEIPNHILNKPGKLNDYEYEVMKKHPNIGASLLKKLGLDFIIPGVLEHQERFDGTGYPYGLSGNDISMDARILAIVDAYDALTSDRVYRKGCSSEKALEEIKKSAGTHFDPELVEVFIKIMS